MASLHRQPNLIQIFYSVTVSIIGIPRWCHSQLGSTPRRGFSAAANNGRAVASFREADTVASTALTASSAELTIGIMIPCASVKRAANNADRSGARQIGVPICVALLPGASLSPPGSPPCRAAYRCTRSRNRLAPLFQRRASPAKRATYPTPPGSKPTFP